MTGRAGVESPIDMFASKVNFVDVAGIRGDDSKLSDGCGQQKRRRESFIPRSTRPTDKLQERGATSVTSDTQREQHRRDKDFMWGEGFTLIRNSSLLAQRPSAMQCHESTV